MSLEDRLIQAVKNDDLDEVKRLHENGADLTARDNTAVRCTAFGGNLLMIKYLHENGVDLTVGDNCAIGLAAFCGHLSMVKYLVENGADLTADDNFAVCWAANNRHWSVVKYLYLHGAPEKYVPAKLLAEIKAEIALRRAETRKALLLNKCMCFDVAELISSYVT